MMILRVKKRQGGDAAKGKNSPELKKLCFHGMLFLYILAENKVNIPVLIGGGRKNG